MNCNIKIAYALAYIRYSWFWLGTWVYYYLRFTNYAGIGIIETVLIITMTVFEIPTGALADLLGKKNCLILSSFIQFVGSIYMALAGSFFDIAFSVFILSVGATLYSGTLEALVYDSLKAKRQESRFNKIIANVSSVQLFAVVISGAVSGVVYTLNPSLPYYLSGVLFFIGFVLSFFLQEPHVDTVKFSLNNFFIQTKQGFRQLFRTSSIARHTLLLLSITGILVIADEMGESFLGVEFGFKEGSIGIFFALIYLIAATVSQLTPRLSSTFNPVKATVFLSFLVAATFILSPFVGLLLGGITLVVRQSLATITNNLASVIINQHTESKYRATTISSFNMIKNLPYMLSAYFIGSLMDLYSAKNIAAVMGVTILVLITLQLFAFRYLSSGKNHNPV